MNQYAAWSNEEMQIIQKNYSTMPRNELCILLPNRKWSSIMWCAESKLHLGRNLIVNICNEKELKLEEWQKAYIAGLIDGEGSFIVQPQPKRNTFGFEITIANTNKNALDKIREMLNFGRIYKEGRSPASEYYNTRKIGYKFRAYKISEILPLINAIRKYLLIKGTQAELMENMIRLLIKEKLAYGKKAGYKESAEVLTIYHKLRKVNKKGIGQGLTLEDY